MLLQLLMDLTSSTSFEDYLAFLIATDYSTTLDYFRASIASFMDFIASKGN